MKNKRFMMVIMVALMMFSMAAPVMAAGMTPSDQIYYEVHDKDGNIKETGIIPSPYTRYTWEGITLENGEDVVLKRDGRYNFYALAGSRIEFQLNLNRLAHMFTAFEGANGEWFEEYESYGNPSSLSFILSESKSFHIMVMNVSSDPVTINSVSLTF